MFGVQQEATAVKLQEGSGVLRCVRKVIVVAGHLKAAAKAQRRDANVLGCCSGA